MEIELKITKASLDNLTWGDWETIEDGQHITYQDARRLIAKFMVTPDGLPMGEPEAMGALKNLKTSEMTAVMVQFRAAMTSMTEELVPNSKGGD